MAAIEQDTSVERLIRRAWEDEQFAELLRTNPRVAIAQETGVELPARVAIHVHQDDEKTFHLVVPATPQRKSAVFGADMSMCWHSHLPPTYNYGMGPCR